MGYASLWLEQVGGSWRESGKPPCSWPVLCGDDERWSVRAAIDAVVADAYGLSPDEYEHVLSTFSHKSYPKAPDLCLARFEELKAIGLEAFSKKYDPYWDIPLNEALPEPVIDLPTPTDVQKSTGQAAFLFSLAEEGEVALGKVAESGSAYRAPESANQSDNALKGGDSSESPDS